MALDDLLHVVGLATKLRCIPCHTTLPRVVDHDERTLGHADFIAGHQDRAAQAVPVRQRLEQLGADIAGGSPDDLRTFLVAEMNKWGPLIREANITVNE